MINNLSSYLNSCNNKWKGKDIKELPVKHLLNIKLWIINKCEKEGLNYKEYSIYNNINKELEKRDNDKPILVYDKRNISGYGKHYYVDKNGNYLGGEINVN